MHSRKLLPLTATLLNNAVSKRHVSLLNWVACSSQQQRPFVYANAELRTAVTAVKTSVTDVQLRMATLDTQVTQLTSDVSSQTLSA
jgi:hypothetical protein